MWGMRNRIAHGYLLVAKERSGRPWNATFPRSLGRYAAHSPSIETYRIPPCWGSKGRRTRCPLGGFPRRNSLWLNGARDPPAHEPAARNLRWRFASRGLRVRVPLAPPNVSYGTRDIGRCGVFPFGFLASGRLADDRCEWLCEAWT